MIIHDDKNVQLGSHYDKNVTNQVTMRRERRFSC